MKILLVITGLGMGGAEHVVTSLADELVNLGHQVKIAYLSGEAIVLPKNPDIDLIPIGMNSSKDVVKAYLKLRNVVKQFNPDVVHSHMFHSNIISRLLRLTMRVSRIVSSSHNVDEGGKFRMLTYRLTDRLTDISTNVSQEAVDALVEKGAVRAGHMISVVNGIDTTHFCFNSDARQEKRAELDIANKNLVLAIGRLESQKDYPNLLNAISILKKQRKDFKVLIVGDGPLKEEIMLLADKLKITEFIELLGIRRDVPALMSASDIYVMSSAWEGLPMVILEAMACERFVVATDCGGVNEVVGSAGFLVKPKDSTLLAQALNRALNLSDDEHYNIGAAARKRIIDNYSLSANVKAYFELYS